MTSYEAIFRRRSIRKYKNDEISPTMLEKIERFGEDAVGIRPDIRVKWKIFRKEDHQLKGLFRVDAPYYVALYSEICEDYRKNAGCLMEQLSLYLFTKGIGSCYQGGAKLKTDIEKDLELVMIMAFGYPAEPLERSYEDFRRIELKKLVTIRGEKASGSSQTGSVSYEPSALEICIIRRPNPSVCEKTGKDRLSDAAGFQPVRCGSGTFPYACDGRRTVV